MFPWFKEYVKRKYYNTSTDAERPYEGPLDAWLARNKKQVPSTDSRTTEELTASIQARLDNMGATLEEMEASHKRSTEIFDAVMGVKPEPKLKLVKD